MLCNVQLNPEEVGESDSEAHENDCLESGLLSDFDFSILPALEKEYEGYSRFEQYMCLGQELGDVPLCSLYTNTFYMGDYRHIPGRGSLLIQGVKCSIYYTRYI